MIQNMACLLTAELKDVSDDNSYEGDYVFEIPKNEVENGDLTVGKSYKVGVYNRENNNETATQTRRETRNKRGKRENKKSSGRNDLDGDEIGLEVGDVHTIRVDNIGDEGDGIGYYKDNFVVIMKGADDVSEEYRVKIKRVKENYAIGDAIEKV